MQFDIRFIDTTASTNDDAKKAAAFGEKEGLVLWAMHQTAGRGRQSRTWNSPAGNLYFSLLLRPPLPLRDWGNYSFVAGLAVAEALRAFLPNADVKLKWPNDVLVNGKKICGILLESGEGYLVVGIGINVQSFPPDTIYPATSLKAEGTAPPLNDLLDKTLNAFDRFYDIMNKEGFSAIRAAWLPQGLKGPLRVRLPVGSGEISGEFSDLDDQGNLCLKLPDGTERKINAGDVF